MEKLNEEPYYREVKLNGNDTNYRVSYNGTVLSEYNMRELTIGITPCGYCKVTLYIDRKPNYCLVHRLVAQAFLPNPNNCPQVNHKNGIKTDNRVENLEWCSEKYNNNFGKHNQNISNSLKGKAKSEDHILKIIESRNRSPVFQIDMKDGVILEEYRSMREAERSTGIFESNISQCCKGRTRSAGGFRWKYKNKTL